MTEPCCICVVVLVGRDVCLVEGFQVVDEKEKIYPWQLLHGLIEGLRTLDDLASYLQNANSTGGKRALMAAGAGNILILN